MPPITTPSYNPQLASGSTPLGGGSLLDGPPAPPPGAPTRLSQLQTGSGAGPGLTSPQQAPIMGLMMMEEGIGLIASTLPGLAPHLASIMEPLKQLIPRAMAELTGSGSSLPSEGPTPVA